MKRWILLLICSCLLLVPLSVHAAERCVIDNGNLLTDQEENVLDAKAHSIADDYGIDVLILTEDTLQGRNTWEVADNHYYGGNYSGNGILLLISMEYRDWEIATYGHVSSKVSNTKTYRLFDKMSDDLSVNNFYDGFYTYLEALEDTLYQCYRTSGTDFNYTSEEYSENNGMQLLVSLGIGVVAAGITLLVMRGKMNTAKQQHGASGYLQEGSYHLRTQRDVYLYSNTTRVRRSQNNSSGGRSGGGGGRGGSRGKF